MRLRWNKMRNSDGNLYLQMFEPVSVTTSEYCWNISVTKFLTKSGPKIWWHLGLFGKSSRCKVKKIYEATFYATFGEIRLFFIHLVALELGTMVASNIRDSRFRSCHWQILFTIICIEKTKIKKKRPRIANFLKKYLFLNAIQVFDSSYPVDKFWYESRDAVIDANLAKLVETHFLVKPHCGFLNICSWFILCRLRCQLWPLL